MTAVVLLFSFTAVGVILLARDYDGRIATRATAQAIAFQAARAGAQQIDVAALRDDGVVVVDPAAGVEHATATAHALLAESGASGEVAVTVAGDRVTVVVSIDDVIEGGFAGSKRAIVRAEGSARAVPG